MSDIIKPIMLNETGEKIAQQLAEMTASNKSYEMLLNTKADKVDVSAPFNFKGDTTYASLPISGNKLNDTYYCTDRKCRYTWNGEGWYQSSMNEVDYTDELGQLSSEIEEYLDMGKNVILSENTTRELNGISVKWENGTLTWNGTATANAQFRIPLSDEYIVLGDTYTLSLNNISGQRSGVFGITINNNAGNESLTKYATIIPEISVTSDTPYGSGVFTHANDTDVFTVTFTVFEGSILVDYSIDLMLEHGEVKTDYTPFKRIIKDSNYVEKEKGKGLSTNDYTDEDKAIVSSLASNSNAPLRFLVMADIHVGDDDNINYTNIGYEERMRLLVNAINDEIETKQIDFVLCLGDVVTVSTQQGDVKFTYWRDEVAPFINAPIYSIVGNHDSSMSDELWQSYTNNKKQYVIETDRFYIFCMDSCKNFATDGTYNNVIDSEFRALYEIYTDKPIIVALHYWDSTVSYMGQYFEEFDRVILILTAHGHYWADRTITTRNIHHLEIGCFTGSHLETYFANFAETQDTGRLWGFNIIEIKDNYLRSYRIQPAIDYGFYDMPYTVSQEINLYPMSAKAQADIKVSSDKTDFYIRKKLKSLEERIALLES